MNKKTIALISVFTLFVASVNVANAGDVVFEPVTASNTYEYIQTPKAIQQPIVTTSPGYTVNATQIAAATGSTSPTSTIAGDNYRVSITGLENEQVELRTKLQTFNTQYTEIEQRYQNVSLERKNMKKNIRETEKKIKSLERIKTKLQKEATIIQ